LMENWADEYDDVDGGDVDSESGEENNGEDDGKNHR